MSFTAVPFEGWHAEQIKFGLQELCEIGGNVRHMVLDLSNQEGHAVTVLDGSTPVAIFAGTWEGDGQMKLHSLMSDQARKKPISLYRTIKACMGPVIKVFDLSIIDVMVHKGYSSGIRFAKSFGFDIIEIHDDYLLMRYERCQE